MPLLFLQQWIPDGALHALGWTFLHSLWLGLLAAMFAAIIMMSTRRSAAHLRYQLLGLVMTSFILATFVTFCYYLQLPVTTTNDAVATNTGIITNVVTSGYPVVVAEDAGFIEKLAAWFDANINVVVIIWALFFVMNCLKLFTGLASVHRLRQYRTKKAPAAWEEKFPALIAALGIKQKVVLLQSALVKVPVAVGILRPVVLVPIGLLMHLPAEQAETILLHELAHIKRKDYLVNLLQRIAEAIFFFNPALLWISSLIRIEREACCDDVVLAHTPQRRNYLEALVAFQEYTAPLPSYALGISNKKNQLLQRVKRIITLENRKAGWAERIVLLAGVIFMMAFTVIKQQEDAKEESKTEPVSSVVTTANPRNQFQPVPSLQTQVLPGISFAGDMEYTIPNEIKRTSIAVVPADQLRISSNRTRNIILSKLVYRDTPRVKIQPVIIQPARMVTYTIINRTYTREDGGDTKETVTAIGPRKIKYFFLKENGRLETIRVNGKKIDEGEFYKYQEAIQAINFQLQPEPKPSGEEIDKKIKSAEVDIKMRDENVKRQMEKIDAQMKEVEDRMDRKKMKEEEKDRKENNKVKISDGKPGEGKTRIEEPRIDQGKPRKQEPRTSGEGNKANEDKPVSEGAKTKPGVNNKFEYTSNNSNNSQKTEVRSLSLNNESKQVALDQREEMKVDAGQWKAEEKWDVDLKSTLVAKAYVKESDASQENIFKNNRRKLFEPKPRRQPTSPRKLDAKPQNIPPPEAPGGKEKPKDPKTKVDL